MYTRPPAAVLLLAAALSFTAPVAVAPVVFDNYTRQRGIDAEHYAFAITLRDETEQIDAVASMSVRFVERGITGLWFELANEGAGGKGMRVEAVTSNGTPVRFTHSGDRLTLTLVSAPALGDLRTFVVRYHGVPASGLRIGPNKYGARTYFSLNWPNLAHQWLPTIDHPSDKATNEFIVTAPAKYQVVANGALVEERDLGDGRRITHWKESAPIATWLFAFAAGEFAVHHAGSIAQIPIESWTYLQDRDTLWARYEPTAREALSFFIEQIGPYSYEKLANVQAAGLSGGTEHASAIFYGESSITPQSAVRIVAHEIAHQWWGNAVTERDWDDVWLSEGFATYFTLLYTEHWKGRDAFVRLLQQSRDVVLTTEKSLPTTPIIHNGLADMAKVTNRLVYEKGAWTLHMLRALIGTDKFWEGIRTYYARYKDRNASTDDLRRVFEEVNGTDLSWFFDQWLRRAGHPQLQATWQYDATRKVVQLDIEQLQHGESYRLPLDIGVSFGATNGRRERVELRERRQHFEFNADSEPTVLVLDPDTWSLIEATVTKR
jgi:aminopeptidase N